MTLMTHLLHLPIAAGIRLHDQPLLLPVLQHLLHPVMRDTGPLHGDALLERSLEAEVHIQTGEDGVVLPMRRRSTTPA